MWRGSASEGAKSDMFIHMMDNHYCSPKECDFFSNSSGDCMYWKDDNEWFQDNAELPTFKVNMEEKAQAFVNMVKTRATYYDNGNNLLITWGCDFTFLSAPVSYDNMDKLIKYVNANEERFGVHVQYAVFSDYIKAVHQHKKQWDVYEGDFMPYASDPDAYWTGYYTSRGRTKGISRRVMNELAAAELYLSLAKVYELPVDLQAVFDKVMKLRKAEGEFQHHDAITGHGEAGRGRRLHRADGGRLLLRQRGHRTVLGAILNVRLTHNLTLAWEQMDKGKLLGAVLVNDRRRRCTPWCAPWLPVSCAGGHRRARQRAALQINVIPDWSVERANGTHVCTWR